MHMCARANTMQGRMLYFSAMPSVPKQFKEFKEIGIILYMHVRVHVHVYKLRKEIMYKNIEEARLGSLHMS